MNQQPINRMWAEYRRVEMLNKAQRICERYDRAATYAPEKMKREAMILARYWINRCR